MLLKKIWSTIQFRYTTRQLWNYMKYKRCGRESTIANYRPLWLLIYVTDLCNLRCKMCPHHTSGDSSVFSQAKQLNSDFIPINLLEEVFAKFPESYFVMLAGVGEPLLHPQIKNIITLCEKSHKKIKLVTNGTMLTEELADFLTGNRALCQIQVSLNAPEWETYHEICQGSRKEFDSVVRNIHTLVKKKKDNNSRVEIAVSAVCGNEFKNKAGAFLQFADSLGVDLIEIFRYIDFQIKGCSMSSLEEDKLFVAELTTYAQKYIRTAYNLPHLVSGGSFSPDCDWFWKCLSVDSRGNIGSCGRVISPDAQYGNVSDSDDVWNNTYMCEMRQRFLDNVSLPSEYCKNCVENNRGMQR